MLSEKGYHRPTYEEILQTKIQKAKELFGDDIDTSELTPLGKFMRMGAYDLAQAYEDLEHIYYARFPNTASGINLDRLCPFASISRNPASRAIHLIRVYSTKGIETETDIDYYQILTCGANDSITFHNDMPFVLPPLGGYVDVEVSCTVAGTIGNVRTINKLVNPIAEIDRIEYIKLVSEGEEIESDYDLRQRFAVAVEGVGSSNINAIRAAITRVTGVKSVNIIVNDSNDTVNGRPPRSFECYVYGGEGATAEKEIAEAIFNKTPIGIKPCSTSAEPVTVQVYDAGGYPHDIAFSHTDNVIVTVNIRIKKNASFGQEGETEIQTNVSEYINNLGSGADVILTTLYSRIYAVTGVDDVVSITLSTDGTEGEAANINIEAWQVAQSALDNVKIRVVTE